jgi:hypothetical protein
LFIPDLLSIQAQEEFDGKTCKLEMGGLQPPPIPRLRGPVEAPFGDSSATGVFLSGQNLAHSPGVNAIVRCDVMLMLAAEISQPNVDGFFIGKLSLFHVQVPWNGARELDLVLQRWT